MKITNVSIKKIIHYFIYIYIIFLPIDAALPKIMYIGSPLNLISIIIILLTILYVVLFQNGIITNNNKLKILIIMYLYFIYSSFIGLQLGVNTFSLFGFSLHALLTITILSS